MNNIVICRVMFQLVLSQEKKITEKKNRRCGFIFKTLQRKRSSHMKRQETNEKLCIPISEYDVKVFRKFIDFVHCGSVEVDASTVIGKCIPISNQYADEIMQYLQLVTRCYDINSMRIQYLDIHIYSYVKLKRCECECFVNQDI